MNPDTPPVPRIVSTIDLTAFCITGPSSITPDATGDDYRPTASHAPVISAIDAAEWLGRSLGLEGIMAVPPAELGREEREAFAAGNAAGIQSFEEDEAERAREEEDRQAEAFAPIEDRVHQSELAEGGYIVEERGSL